MAAAEKRLSSLAQQLGHNFTDPERLRRAITHRSFGAEHNERLEFLGDSVLNLVISAELYRRYPDLTEGELTRLRAMLVRAQTLAGLARSIRLGEYLRLGGGELKSGGFDRDSILADALEAVLGAVYEDGGLGAASQAIGRLYADRLAELNPSEIPKDAKTELQEHLQRQGLPLPVYTLRDISGEAHNQSFVVDCHIEGLSEPVTGRGTSRRAAEQDAAARGLEQLRGSDSSARPR